MRLTVWIALACAFVVPRTAVAQGSQAAPAPTVASTTGQWWTMTPTMTLPWTPMCARSSA